eukprot:6179642-Pleurochrysis_carterae.AAC.1
MALWHKYPQKALDSGIRTDGSRRHLHSITDWLAAKSGGVRLQQTYTGNGSFNKKTKHQPRLTQQRHVVATTFLQVNVISTLNGYTWVNCLLTTARTWNSMCSHEAALLARRTGLPAALLV